MASLRRRSEEIRNYILSHVENSPNDIAKKTAHQFGITRQAVNKHLRRLLVEGFLIRSGSTRANNYQLATLQNHNFNYDIYPNLPEDVVWKQQVRSLLGDLPDNVIDIWNYGFSEMFNNVVDHSEGSSVSVHIRRNSLNTEMLIVDDGIGIFKKIQTEMGLLDSRHSVLELSKGKLTTDPNNHTGEGIFFSSRMFDSFDILSQGVYFSHKFDSVEDWILETNSEFEGTAVWMLLNNHTSRTTKIIFDEYTSRDDYYFVKTVVPVKLASYSNDKLVSRSQAKRLLARVELFEIVLFDFSEVDSIGPAFADEIFRVFARVQPNIKLLTTATNPEIDKMIARARQSVN